MPTLYVTLEVCVSIQKNPIQSYFKVFFLLFFGNETTENIIDVDIPYRTPFHIKIFKSSLSVRPIFMLKVLSTSTIQLNCLSVCLFVCKCSKIPVERTKLLFLRLRYERLRKTWILVFFQGNRAKP